MAHYLDTSALVKLVSHEPESGPLRSWLGAADRVPVSCDLARTELLRACRRLDAAATAEARGVLDAITLIAVPSSTFDAAGLLSPRELRSLDAVHLASALSLGDDLDGLITYDARLADAATANGIAVIAPTGAPAASAA